MRAVDLPSVPALLSGPDSAGELETAAASDYYAAQPPPTRSFKFGVYKRAAIRDALNAAFGFRCAYCESQYGATQPVDVEHYRPKAAVVTSDGTTIKPGYYWLAACWHNLLPSCIDCNRVRKHTNRDGVVRLLGKGNSFPLADENARATGPKSDLARERPLILSPYEDRPERHLDFQIDGVVRPRVVSNGRSRDDARGRATIDATGMNRPQLTDARAAHARLVAVQLERVADAERNIRRDPSDHIFRGQLRRELVALRELQAPDARYPTMTSQLIAAARPGLPSPRS